MERVSIIEGKTPVVFVAPHGNSSDDVLTARIVEVAATSLKAYAVINRGWKRAAKYDYDLEHADCNDLNHLHEDVVIDEFLDPIKRFTNRIRKKFPWAYMITIHGVSNDVRKKVNDPELSMIVGFGAGTPPSLTCKPWMKDLFCYQAIQYGWNIYEGRPGGPYSAWARPNLCQFFRKWEPNAHINAMQIEIVRDWRSDNGKADFIAECIADYIGEVTNYGNWDTPHGFKVPLF